MFAYSSSEWVIVIARNVNADWFTEIFAGHVWSFVAFSKIQIEISQIMSELLYIQTNLRFTHFSSSFMNDIHLEGSILQYPSTKLPLKFQPITGQTVCVQKPAYGSNSIQAIFMFKLHCLVMIKQHWLEWDFLWTKTFLTWNEVYTFF